MTPPDYKEKARELCDKTLSAKNHTRLAHVEPEDPCEVCALLATALAQADALGYARGLEEAANMVNDMADEADDRGNVKRRDFLFTIEDKFRAKARALTAEPAKECVECVGSGSVMVSRGAFSSGFAPCPKCQEKP
jgi:hypothetical protein